MASAVPASKPDLFAIASLIASQEMVYKSDVVEAIEKAIQKAARAHFGAENDIRAKFDPLTGDLCLWRVVEVVEDVENCFKQVDLTYAIQLDEGARSGDFIIDPLSSTELGHIDLTDVLLAAKQAPYTSSTYGFAETEEKANY